MNNLIPVIIVDIIPAIAPGSIAFRAGQGDSADLVLPVNSSDGGLAVAAP